MDADELAAASADQHEVGALPAGAVEPSFPRAAPLGNDQHAKLRPRRLRTSKDGKKGTAKTPLRWSRTEDKLRASIGKRSSS